MLRKLITLYRIVFFAWCGLFLALAHAVGPPPRAARRHSKISKPASHRSFVGPISTMPNLAPGLKCRGNRSRARGRPHSAWEIEFFLSDSYSLRIVAREKFKMSKRDFLIPLAAAVAMLDGTAFASTDGAVVESAATAPVQQNFVAPIPELSRNMVLERHSDEGVSYVWHSSHASHASHASHGSHCSGYSYCQ
ncbi:hypothetical protein ACTTAI_16490 [Rhodobacter capsulatus]|uniref:hypothetical protein n=1 Tax=Rhodobacter capsulatus TaxID=1061 RepID=UPI00402A11BC